MQVKFEDQFIDLFTKSLKGRQVKFLFNKLEAYGIYISAWEGVKSMWLYMFVIV